MELTVLQPRSTTEPWYSAGLRFTCTQCGNCCTGGPGYVWMSRKEIRRLAAHLKLSQQQVIDRYCRPVGDKFSLREQRNSLGEHDCIFLKEEKTSRQPNGENIVFTKRVCTIYNYRPLQCRTWPFWEGTLATPESWRHAAERCHGMNYGSKIYSKTEVEALRDAQDWPAQAPTSENPTRRRRKP